VVEVLPCLAWNFYQMAVVAQGDHEDQEDHVEQEDHEDHLFWSLEAEVEN
jgi:hypothetical protein